MLKISKYKLPQNRAGNHAGSSPAVGTINIYFCEDEDVVSSFSFLFVSVNF